MKLLSRPFLLPPNTSIRWMDTHTAQIDHETYMGENRVWAHFVSIEYDDPRDLQEMISWKP